MQPKLRSVERHRRLGGVALAVLLTTTAPAPAAPAAPAAHAGPQASKQTLAGTSWQLVEIRSMDDTQGITRPAAPSRYTLRLQPDGRAALQLDCNRAAGTWSMQASSDSSNGSFRFGPLAATSALCPPPSLGEWLGRQLPFVRGYTLQKGRLYLSLMADGGVLVWEPLAKEGVAFSNTPDIALEQAIRRASPDYRRPVVEAGGRPRPARYVHARMDLDGDGRDEVFVYLMGSIFCGTGGCNLQLFRQTAGGYQLVNNFSASEIPIIVSEQRTRGWRDLWRLQSGGGVPATYVRQVFNGRRYVEAGRIQASQITPRGSWVLSGTPGYGNGAVLQPSR